MTIQQEVTTWAQERKFDERHLESGYFLGYERVICSKRENLNIMVRLDATDTGYRLVLGSCPGGYGGDHEHWQMAVFGDVRDIEGLSAVWNGIMAQHVEVDSCTVIS